MTQEVLNQFADVVVVNAPRIALEISLQLKAKGPETQRNAFAGSNDAGYFYLYRIDAHQDTVYECVASAEGGDAITSLYKNHRIFASAGELIKARERLVRAIAEKVGLSAEAVGVDDPGRGRTLGLRELSTGQLIDLLAERMGSSIVVSDSHAAALGVTP